MISIFQYNVDKLNELNEKWQDLITKAVDNPNGLMNAVIQVANFVIQFLLDRFVEAHNNNELKMRMKRMLLK